MIPKDLMKHRREFLRALANRAFEQMPDGRILFPKAQIMVGGGLLSSVNGRDERFDDNLLPTAGLNHMLDVVLHAGTQIATWYLAPFKNNVSPTSALTGANFNATLDELTEYDEATRQAYVEAAASGGVTTNSASKAEFTINASVNNWGAALLSSSTKEDGSDTLLAAVKYAAVRALVDDDVLSLRYDLTGTST